MVTTANSPPQHEKKDLLFVLTDRSEICVLSYDAEKAEIVTRYDHSRRIQLTLSASGKVQDLQCKPLERTKLGIVDPESRVIAMYLVEGLLKIMPINDKGELQSPYNVRLDKEHMVLDITFLHGCLRPTLAILYQDSKETTHVKTLEVDFEEKECHDGPIVISNAESGANRLIALPRPLKGMLIVGEHSISYHNGTYSKSAAMKCTNIETYGFIDPDGSRILLGDHIGRLFCLVLTVTDNKVTKLNLEFLAETSIPSSINYLDSGVVFIGSQTGDSQLIRLCTEPNPSNDQLTEVLDTYPNLGPISDFCFVDTGKQGQPQLVTCSGVFKDGSLRVVRNGIGMTELPGMKGLWCVDAPTPFEKYIISSFVSETRVLAITGEEMEEIDVSGLIQDQSTIYCGSLGKSILQATASTIRMIPPSGQYAEWVSNQGSISGCAANDDTIVITIGAQLFTFSSDGKQLIEKGTLTMPHEISCVSIAASGFHTPLIVVGLWQENSVHLIQANPLKSLHSEKLGDIIPRSVLFSTLESVDYLFIGMGDGRLISFTLYQAMEGGAQLENQKTLTLGTHPIILTPFFSKGQQNIFASSDRPTVIYSHHGKLVYASVNIGQVTHMCKVDSSSFPESVGVASEDCLLINSIDEIQKLHVQTHHLGEHPRRIAHSETDKCFVVGCARFDMNERGEMHDSYHLRLLDEATFEVLDSIQLDTFENPSSIKSVVYNEIDGAATYFYVGTAVADPQERLCKAGRILTITAHERKLRVIHEVDVKGAVYGLAPFGENLLLACVNAKVHMYRLTDERELKSETTPVDGFSIALGVSTREQQFAVFDLVRSVSLYSVEQTNIVKEVARDLNPAWAVAMCLVAPNRVLAAENGLNLYMLTCDTEANDDEARSRLEWSGGMHLGQLVNGMERGALVMKMPEAELDLTASTVVLATSSGALALVAELPPDLYSFLAKVEKVVASKYIKGVGGLTHGEWRSTSHLYPAKLKPAEHFVDGDLVEMVLELDRSSIEAIALDVGVTFQELIHKIELVQRALH